VSVVPLPTTDPDSLAGAGADLPLDEWIGTTGPVAP